MLIIVISMDEDFVPSDIEKEDFDDGEIDPICLFEQKFIELPKRPIIPEPFPDQKKKVYTMHPFASPESTESAVTNLKIMGLKNI